MCSELQEKDPIKKAAKTLMMADSIGCKKFVRPKVSWSTIWLGS